MYVEPSEKSFSPSRLNDTEPSEKQANFANKNITNLPGELLVKFFSYFDTRDLLNCQLVNRHWQELIDRDHMLALTYYRRCHPTERQINPLTVERYHSSIQGWLRGFSNLGRESAAQLDKFLQHKHFTEILFFSIAKVLAKAKALTCQDVGTIKHFSYVREPSFSPDGNYLVTVSNHSVKISELVAGEWQEKVTIHHCQVNKASFSPDGKRLVTASDDNTAKIWELEGGQWREKTILQHSDSVRDAFFSPDGRHLVTISNIAKIWELEGGQWQTKAILRHFSEVTRACFSPDGNHLVTINFQFKTAKIWGLIADQWKKEFAIKSCDESSSSGFVNDVCFSPNGRYLAVAAADTCRIWELVDGKWKQSAALEHSHCVATVRFSPDGNHLVTVTAVFTVKIWGAVDNRWLEKATTQHYGGLRIVCFSPDGSHLVTASTDRTATIWGLVDDDWQEKIAFQHSGLLAIASFSPDGKHLVLISNGEANDIWGVVDGRWQLKATIGSPCFGFERNASFSPDGYHLVSTFDEIAKIWVLKSEENEDSC